MRKLINYIKGVRAELRHVSWPTRRQTTLFTTIVIVVSISVAYFLGFFDFIFTKLLDLFIL